jgi:energy-coupling factor transport system ATP-binding protein
MVAYPESTPGTSPAAVAVRNLSFRYRMQDDDDNYEATVSEPLDQPRTIADISFTLNKGKLLLIAGPSGCGKSTLQ